ncbi:cystatin-related protein 1-like [Onychomys torridus]|uniref:cystatin-related protein 1-like n=1 Tax=Onychomys torridus TaxID=38674 RepID=UPI00167FBCDE|nr:cystatin-related protein 1-like [Onychomys torridus]
MGNTLWSSLILQATLILLLNSSHAKTKYIGTATTKNSADITEQLALDIINIIYNLHSNGTYLSKVMIKRLKVVSNMANGRVELRPTMCTQAESVLDECPLKKKLLVIQEGHMIIQYRKSERRQRLCSKFQSELSNCPFSEHPEQQKDEQEKRNFDFHPGTFMVTLKRSQKVKYVVSITDDASVN